MQVQRMSAADVERAGGPAGAAAHLHSLVAGHASVAAAVAEIAARVRAQGDAAVLDYTRRFDTAGAQPRPLVVAAEELDAALEALPRELVAGLQVTIANVARVADAAVGGDVAVELPQGHRVLVREVPVRAAAVYVPG